MARRSPARLRPSLETDSHEVVLTPPALFEDIMAMIKTACWFAPCPEDHIRVGISRGLPRALPKGYRVFRQLAPGEWFNRIRDPERWAERYKVEVLARLDPEDVVQRLAKLGEGKVVVLCCFEQPPPDTHWCHRALVSVWLHEKLGLEVPELGYERLGGGRLHPKLHPALRTPGT